MLTDLKNVKNSDHSFGHTKWLVTQKKGTKNKKNSGSCMVSFDP